MIGLNYASIAINCSLKKRKGQPYSVVAVAEKKITLIISLPKNSNAGKTRTHGYVIVF
jgi:hypothetical protein